MAPIMSAMFGLAALLVQQVAAQCPNQAEPANGPPVMAEGYESKLLVSGLRAPRGIIFDTEGNLLVAESGGGGIRRIELEDKGGIDVCVKNSKQIVANGLLNHGVAVSEDGKTLFASTSTDVYSYDYDVSDGTTGTPKNLITGMKQGGYHQTRTLLIPKNAPGKLLVSRGSNDNVDAETQEESSGRSQIRYWDIDGFTGEPVEYQSGTILGWGLRNSVGVGEDPATGGIWSVENSLDDMTRDGADVHNNNPGEELNYHGVINATDNELEGANYGYPVCFAVWDASTVSQAAGGDVKTGMQITAGNGAGNREDSYCAEKTVSPRLTFPAHTAPLDVHFTADGSAAYISFHGSWNRDVPDGYRLSRIDFKDGQPIAPQDGRDHENKVMWNPDNSVCPNKCFRPVGIAIDGKGRIFLTSDQSGEIFVITPPE